MKEVTKKLNIPAICKLLGVIVLVTTILIFVYLTNGTQNVYLHLIYIPIILAAYFWGVRGSLIAALVSGILAGPFMPLIVSQGIMQSTENWITRIIILSIVGSITGILFKKVDKLNEEIRKKDLINPFTGLYNTNKLIEDLQEKIHNKEKFTIISIKLTNIEGIGKYVNHLIVENLTKNFINELTHGCRRDALYASSDNEIISIACPECDYIEKTKKTIKKYSNAINIDGYSVRLAIKAGVYNYSGEIENPLEVFIKARIAYEQGDEHESGIYYYNDHLEEKRKEMYEIAGTLNDALKNKELYLLYQPKINIFENTVAGVEILIRWDRGSRKPVGPNVFIKIAEEIGLIKEISKYVIEHASEQIVNWENRGIVTNYAINLTAKELLDEDFIEWSQELIERKNLDRSRFEIEITERVINLEGKKLLAILKHLRGLGYKISIDDFGTGYNSLMSVGEIPFDLLKIDKYFIDRLKQKEVKELVSSIISYTHGLDKMVVAEGVETKQQLDILKELMCDKVQGYYYSKPLLPYEFEEYYKKYSIKR